MRHIALTALAATATAASAAAVAQPAAAADRLIGLTGKDVLVEFTADNPSNRRAVYRLSGLAPGERAVGIDARPATGQLHVLTDRSRTYVVAPGIGTLTPIGATFTPALNGTQFGFDFNPVVDRIRVTSDAEQNLRLVPSTGGVASNDGPLAYVAGDPGAGSNPAIVGSAYTANVAGTTTTQLVDLDAARDVLALQDPPNAGGLRTIGALGVDIDGPAGFDIGPADAAYAAVTPKGSSATQLRRVNLTTGAASRIGGRVVGRSLKGLAVFGTLPDDESVASTSVRARRVGSSTRVTVSVREFATVRIGGRTLRTGEVGGTVRGTVRAARGERVSVRVTDGAGNAVTRRATVR